MIRHLHWPDDNTLQEIEALVAEQAVREGCQCIHQGLFAWELK